MLLTLLVSMAPLYAQFDDAYKIQSPGQIVIDSKGVFTLYDPDAEALAERSALVQARLNALLQGQPAAQIRVGGKPSLWQVLLNNQTLVTVTAYDAQKHRSSPQALAEQWAASLRRVLQDKPALKMHLTYNVQPELVLLKEISYSRSEQRLTAVEGLKSSGYTYRRIRMFVNTPDPTPEQVFVRDADGSYVVYNRLRAPQETKPDPSP